ncbi:hypothetical protein M9H77_30595 [Catharanthus roseus]|uniref:Uncharacterized protein n=1 Tax=Catharanthus roseus TaxID=4058 RepID=A0ACC0A1Z3_CATRO|nr:hypothetical protein M9H77_30595 [Catharanthus roseus]
MDGRPRPTIGDRVCWQEAVEFKTNSNLIQDFDLQLDDSKDELRKRSGFQLWDQSREQLGVQPPTAPLTVTGRFREWESLTALWGGIFVEVTKSSIEVLHEEVILGRILIQFSKQKRIHINTLDEVQGESLKT